MKNIKNLYLQLPNQHKIILNSFSIFFMFLLLIPTENTTVSSQPNENSLEIGKRYQLNVPMNTALPDIKTTNPATEQPTQAQNQAKNKVNTEQQLTWQTAKVRPGDSLAKIFKRLGFSSRTTHNVSAAKGNESKLLTKLDIGDKLHIGSNDKGQLVELSYPLSKTETLHVQLINGSYQSYTETKAVEIREAFVHGVIKSNFWNAAADAGMSDNQIINLANIFGWDIDFALDIREGDSFHIIYEKRYIEGEYIDTGKILAAEFINQNDQFQAIRFSDGEYYTPEGNSMRKAFLRAPVNFKYISSNFKRKRFHPIQKRWKSHNGTDYRAKTGTPVVAAGNGKVIQSTFTTPNGNYVFIQHGNGILTKYLHFSKRAVKKGQRVKQGQVIGYVGSTGWSEAPHLHYEFLLNGVPRNPRTVKLPDAQPIAKKFRQEFSEVALLRTQELSSFKRTFFTADDTAIPAD